MKRILPILIAVLVVLTLASCKMEFDSKGKACIISVGIGYGWAGGPPVLEGCVDDALEMGLCLTKQIKNQGVEVDTRYLICRGADPDEQSMYYPSPTHLINMINSLQLEKEDLLVFYYSGHGVAEDAPALALPPEEEGGYYSPLDMKELYKILQAKGCQTVVLMDCCFSGGTSVDEVSGSFTSGLESVFKDTWSPSTAVIAACKADEESTVAWVPTAEGGKQKHGYLTIGLLENMGWVHSDARTETVPSGSQSYKVKGYVRDYITDLTVSELQKAVGDYWAANYTMTCNEVRNEIRLIP